MTWKEYCERPEKVWHKFSPINVNDSLWTHMTCDECSAKIKPRIELVRMGDLAKHFDEHQGIFTDGTWVWTK